MDYKKLLQTSEYDFLRTNPYLGNHILLLTLGGSRAYGTNLPTSDVDIRGIAATPMSALFGLEKDFEQVVETNTDTVIYSMQKMLQLLIVATRIRLKSLAANRNIIFTFLLRDK